MNKKEFKELDREQMIIAFNQLKDDYSSLFDELEQEKEKNNNLIKQLQEQNTEIQDISRQLRQSKEKNKKLEATNKAFHRFIMFNGGKDIEDITATEYMRIRQEGYNDGRYDEQQKAEEIIMNNYIRKDKIKEKREE